MVAPLGALENDYIRPNTYLLLNSNSTKRNVLVPEITVEKFSTNIRDINVVIWEIFIECAIDEWTEVARRLSLGFLRAINAPEVRFDKPCVAATSVDHGVDLIVSEGHRKDKRLAVGGR